MASSVSVGQRRLAIGLFLAISATAFETMSVGTVLPTIAEHFHGDRLYGATFVAYMLANLLSLVTAGSRADRGGLAAPFGLGAVSFAVGLVVAGAAPSMAVVLLGRALQGAGTGVFSTLSLVAVRRAYDDTHQRRMYAVLSTAWVLPSLIAPFAAGWITSTLGWRWVFVGLVPLAGVVVVLTLPALAVIDRTHAIPSSARASQIGRANV
jgi:MFS family permease